MGVSIERLQGRGGITRARASSLVHESTELLRATCDPERSAKSFANLCRGFCKSWILPRNVAKLKDLPRFVANFEQLD